MSNSFTNPSVVAKEALLQLENNCVMAELVHKGYESEWNKKHNGYEPGQTVTVDCPKYSRVQDGSTMNVVDVVSRSTTFSLNYRKHVAHRVTAEEATYNDKAFIDKVIKPAMVALANYIDGVLLGLYKGIPNQVGVPGTTPNSFLTFALANAKLSNHACPMTDRRVVVNPLTQAYIADHLKGLFVTDKVGRVVERANFASNFAGFDWYVSQNVQNHTCGTAAGLSTVLVNDTVAEGDTSINIDTNGSWTLTLTEGDIFTIADCNGVNPITGQSTGELRQFVCHSHTDNGNDATISCTPGVAPYNIYSASAPESYLPYQNVDALPVNNKAVVVDGTAGLVHPVNLAFHKDCLGLAMVPLNIDPGVAWSAQESYNGYTVTVTKDFDITNYQTYIRFDVLFGVKVLNPFLGCRVAG